MASESEIVKKLREILETADLDTTTSKAVRAQIEEELGVDLSDKKVFIREQIDLFLRRRHQQQEGHKGNEEEKEKVEKAKKEEKSKDVKDRDEPEKEKKLANVKHKKRETRVENEEVDSKRVRAKIERAIKESLVKEKKKRVGGGGFSKICNLSPELQAVLGKEELPRTQVVKLLWEYIRHNNLQDPGNKRNIICDNALRALFGTDKTDMFKMNKLLSKHMWPTEEMSGP